MAGRTYGSLPGPAAGPASLPMFPATDRIYGKKGETRGGGGARHLCSCFGCPGGVGDMDQAADDRRTPGEPGGQQHAHCKVQRQIVDADASGHGNAYPDLHVGWRLHSLCWTLRHALCTGSSVPPVCAICGPSADERRHLHSSAVHYLLCAAATAGCSHPGCCPCDSWWMGRLVVADDQGAEHRHDGDCQPEEPDLN